MSCPICKGPNKENNKYCSYSCRNKAINANRNYKDPLYKEKLKKSFERRTVENKYEEIVKCKNCQKEFIVIKSHNSKKITKVSCSTACRNIIRSKDPKYKERVGKSISDGMKKRWLDSDYRDKISKSEKNKIFSSKTERLIRDYFINNYKDDEWTFGGSLKIEDEYLSRDLYSNKMKVCFEFDGIFHFKKIFEFEKKQKKDVLLEKWCIENEYILIRMSDSYFDSSENPIKEIEQAIKDRKSIKFYND